MIEITDDVPLPHQPSLLHLQHAAGGGVVWNAYRKAKVESMKVLNEIKACRPSGDPETLTVTSLSCTVPLGPDHHYALDEDASPVEVYIGGYRLIVDGNQLVAAVKNAMNVGR